MRLVALAIRLALAAAALAVALVAAEAGARVLDGYELRHVQLRHTPSAQGDLRRALAYVDSMAVANGVDRSWFTRTPDEPDRTPERLLETRMAAYGLQGLYEWNRDYLKLLACDYPEVFKQSFGGVKDLFYFEPIRPGQFPRYRFLRDAVYPSQLVTNNFGWRGPAVAADKPKGNIRIAFVGASTTVGLHGMPLSYPEFIGVWLNLWARARGLTVRFEAINAGREGINSNSIAEVVRQELMPVEPDLVVYYEGSNQFWPAYVTFPDGPAPPRPTEDPRATMAWPLEKYSALAVRARSLYEASQNTGSEPPKPAHKVEWPPELDEFDPPLESAVMPLNLHVILPDLDTMRAALATGGGELAVSSFYWLVWEGMRLDPARHGAYSYLNRTFWPFTYAHIRRMADFQNRLLAKYARTRGLEFIDFAGTYPPDPELFGDAIHFTYEGVRLQAWVMLQQIIPILERRLATGVLPRADREAHPVHPAFAAPPRQLIELAAIQAECRP